MKTRDTLEVLFLLFSWTVYFVTAVHRNDMFPYGTVNGDSALQEGDDEISKALKLKKPLYFYENQFSELYVATNGIISTQYLPMEKQYVDNGFPTDFPVIAPFLADIDTSNSRGTIYYRLEESPSVLNRVSREVRRGFPRIHFAATHTVIATWENVGAHEEVEAHPGPSSRVNTFQVVLAYDEVNTFALFLYPDDGLRFFGTRPKETYNVELELPARVGFSRAPPIYPHMEEPYYSVTSTEKTVKNLYQMGNTGVPGVWLFHIGNCFSFDNVVPAAVQWVAPTAMPLRENKEDADATISDYSEYVEDYFYDQTNDNNPKDQQGSELPPLAMPKRLPDYSATLLHSSLSRTKEPESLTVQPHVQTYDGDNPLTISSHLSNALPPTPPTPRREDFSIPKTRQSSSEGSSPMESLKAHRENIPVLESIPSLALHHHTVNIDEDLDFGTGVIDDNDGDDKMCASSEQACSPHGYCTEYSSGFCCHCHSGYYGNGRHCLSGGAPQRVNGRVSGLVYVGATPVALDNVDLHSYVVVNDGRAYTAISRLPEPVGWALMPVAPIGGLFGWLFALESPNHKNGFSITGAEFTSVAEITFFPGNQRLTIIQTAQGMSFENYLKMDTRIHGSLPFIVPGATVEREPYKEMYQYSPSSVVSSSVHNYKLVSAEGASETFSYQLHQSITYHECQHRPQSSPKTQQLNVERILITYVREEHVLRYAFTNKVGPVTAEAPGPVPANPCYDGTHDCDAKAQCLPGEGKHFQCQCNTGYRGDGRYCNDIDECKSQPCHTHASCSNTLGSFECQCLPGFQGNGFLCIPLKEWSQTKCEQHRDSLQRGLGHQGGQPAVGTFIPQCDEDGQYRPLQCHGATGHCWCVDSEGQELPSTRRPPGTPPIDCSAAGKALPTQHPETVCERWRKSLMEHYKGQPASSHYIPQCDNTGQFNPVQCYGDSNYCWCVDQDGREVPGTRLHDAVKPACIPTVAPPTTYPLSHPDVRAPLSGTSLLYAQGQQIGALPLNGTRMEKDKASILMALHGSIVVGINYNCMDKKVYWTDLAGRTINRASLEPGAEPETVVSTGLTSPEGLAVDVFRNRMFWVDSGLDKIETSNLDGSNRRVLFDTDLVNPRAIIVDSISGTLFWTDWNRDAPKIEQSTVEGLNRRILVHKGIGLPNALTFNPSTKHLCWADAGTKHLECIAPDGTRRQVIHSNLNYPFSMVLYANHFYYTDWRRDGVIALSRETSKFTDEFLPDQRSHLYGITVASPSCLSEKA